MAEKRARPARPARHLFVTGGVVSSLGKGITAAALAMLLERRGLSVRLQKIDPYLNVDPGTMSPHQHGEVYVLDDGTECDLDLGHYERFTGRPLDARSSVTMGRVYQAVLAGERRGDYLGKTVQVVPHVTDEVKARIELMAAPAAGPVPDVVITEIGGTAGDIEALPVLEAARQLAHESAPGTCAFLHLTLVPFLKAAGEAKTKPTQHSVGQLRQIGIQPDFLACRTERPMLDAADLDKISLFCNVPRGHAVELPDGGSIYDVPAMLAERGLDALVCARLGLDDCLPLDLSPWREALARQARAAQGPGVEIALVGKYTGHKDAYKSIEEALAHAAWEAGACLRVTRYDSDELGRSPSLLEHAAGRDGILVPGGFGARGIPGKLAACRAAREGRVPYFGICLGMQVAVIEFARNVLGLEGADSTEFSPGTPHPVIGLMPGQLGVQDKGGTMRLGGFPMECLSGTKVGVAYGASADPSRPPASARERHRHRYEAAPQYRDALAAAGLLTSATSPCGLLAEAVELGGHPWFVGVQCHPEFASRPGVAHPLFLGFVRAALDRAQARRRLPHGPGEV
jgi:CTP synthase